MSLNWKVRFKNKVWLMGFISVIVTFVYTILGMLDIYPEFTKNQTIEVVNSILTFLTLIGVIVDPTTNGFGDSERALGYDEPYADSEDSKTDGSSEID